MRKLTQLPVNAKGQTVVTNLRVWSCKLTGGSAGMGADVAWSGDGWSTPFFDLIISPSCSGLRFLRFLAYTFAIALPMHTPAKSVGGHAKPPPMSRPRQSSVRTYTYPNGGDEQKEKRCYVVLTLHSHTNPKLSDFYIKDSRVYVPLRPSRMSSVSGRP